MSVQNVPSPQFLAGWSVLNSLTEQLYVQSAEIKKLLNVRNAFRSKVCNCRTLALLRIKDQLHTLEFDSQTFTMSLVLEKRALDLEEKEANKKRRLADSDEKLKAKGQEMMAKHPELFDEERLQKTRELATRLFLARGLDKKVRI